MSDTALRTWCEAVTSGDYVAARRVLPEVRPLLKHEAMDPKEFEIFNRVSQDTMARLAVISKSLDGEIELGCALDPSKPRNAENLVPICKVSGMKLALKPGDVVQCKLDTVEPVKIGRLYGCKAAHAVPMHKADGQPHSAREIFGIASETGALICDDETRSAFAKFKLKDASNGSFTRTARFIKGEDDAKRLVYCVILEPSGDNGNPVERDTDGQWYDTEAVEDSAHWFMAYGRPDVIELNHAEPLSNGNVMVESSIMLCDVEVNGQQIRKGSWVGVWFVGDDKDWNAWQNGDYNGVSIEGNGLIQPDAPNLNPQDVAY